MRNPTRHARLLLSCLLVGIAAVALPAQTDGSVARAAFVLNSNPANICVASPVVNDAGTVYVGSRNNLLTTAGKIWAISAGGGSRSFDTSDWVDASPAIGPDGTLYVGCWNGKFYALRDNGTTLTKLWEYAATSFINSSAAIGRDGTIYFGAGDSNLHALRPDGTLKWKYATTDWVDGSPSIAPNGDILFGSWNSTVTAVDLEGALRWSYTTGGAVLASPAIAADGTVYVGSTDDKFYAFSSSGALLWSYPTGADIEGSAGIGADGTIYFGSNDGYLYALNPDGSLRWRLRLGAAIAGGVAVRADGSILVGGTSLASAPTPGFLAAVNPGGTLKWQYFADDIVDSSPAIGADGRIYFTTYGRRLHTLNGSSTLSGTALWPKFRRDAKHTGRSVTDRRLTGVLGLSIRAQVGTGSDVLVPGVVLSQANKTLLVRTLGPQLASYGVSGTLPTPTMTLYRFASDGTPIPVQANTGWSSVPAEVAPLQNAATTLGLDSLPMGSADSAMLPTLSPGAYTVQISGVSGATGNALVQVYDTQLGAGGLLESISARALVGTGDRVLIAGITVTGAGAKTLLIRGVGPKLTDFGVGGVLAQPNLALYKFVGGGSVVVETNNGWSTAANTAWIKAAATDVGTFALPDGSRDAGMIVTLLPGSYTAQISGAGGTTGVALVELVDVP